MLRLFEHCPTNSKKDEAKDLTPALVDKLKMQDLGRLARTNRFFQKELEPYLLKNLEYCEQRIKLALVQTEKLAKEIQQRTPFLSDLTVGSLNESSINTIQLRVQSNQDVLKKLLEERDTAYRFILSIPISMIGSLISYSLGIGIIKNLLLIYQSLAIAWLSINYELSHTKISLADLTIVFSSKIDNLYEQNSKLLLLCETWHKTTQLQNEEISKQESELDSLLAETTVNRKK